MSSSLTYLLIGLLLLLGLYLGTAALIRAFAQTNPKTLSRLFRWIGGGAAALIALALIFTGRGGVVLGAATLAAPFLFARRRNNAAPPPGAGAEKPPPRPGGMSREEAYATLGLAPGASEAEIRAAHKRLMKACHPDHGGSDALAVRVNQAKDALLG